jgi:hypothetical protein
MRVTLAKFCGFPGCSVSGEKQCLFKRCGNCASVYYCSMGCQKKHWLVHKKFCQGYDEIGFYIHYKSECKFYSKVRMVQISLVGKQLMDIFRGYEKEQLALRWQWSRSNSQGVFRVATHKKQIVECMSHSFPYIIVQVNRPEATDEAFYGKVLSTKSILRFATGTIVDTIKPKLIETGILSQRPPMSWMTREEIQLMCRRRNQHNVLPLILFCGENSTTKFACTDSLGSGRVVVKYIHFDWFKREIPDIDDLPGYIV